MQIIFNRSLHMVSLLLQLIHVMWAALINLKAPLTQIALVFRRFSLTFELLGTESN
jgi:hypothetical protein